MSLKQISSLSIIFLSSCLLMLAYGNFAWDAFLVDDNVCQWFPIIEKAYEQFFNTGHMPVYDFFQTKGLPIANMGYYSLYNPIMLISYALSHFGHFQFNTIAIYICILCGLGNITVYKLCEANGLRPIYGVLCILAYSSSACFIAFHNWYYIFNNYLIIPLIVYAFFHIENKLKYCVMGIILGFDLFLGNIQYTCYHYMCYTILFCGELFLSRRGKESTKNKIYTFFLNISIGIGLSAPIILMGLNISSSFGKKSEFLVGNVETFNLIISAFVPFLPYFSNMPFLPKIPYNAYLEYSAAVILPFLIGCVYFLYRIVDFIRKSCPVKDIAKRVKNERYKKILSILLLCMFWIFFLDKGIISSLLSITPVINRFRFLYKGYFLLTPLLGLCLVYFIPFLKPKLKNIFLMIVFLFSLVGIVNNFVVYTHSRSNFIAKGEHYAPGLRTFEKNKKARRENIDAFNYRVVSFFSTDSIAIEKFYFDRAFNRNYPTLLESFSLSAYEIASPLKHLKQFDKIYNDSAFMTVYANSGVHSYFMQSLENDIKALETQLKQNSIKYLLLQKDSVYSASVYVNKTSAFDSVSIESVKKWDDDFTLITLNGIPSLCRFNDSINVPLNAYYMDFLSFEAKESGKYTLSFSYEKNLAAYIINNDGLEEKIEISETFDGNIELFCKKSQHIFITYKDPLAFAAQFFEIVTTALFIFIIACMFSSKKKGSVC